MQKSRACRKEHSAALVWEIAVWADVLMWSESGVIGAGGAKATGDVDLLSLRPCFAGACGAMQGLSGQGSLSFGLAFRPCQLCTDELGHEVARARRSLLPVKRQHQNATAKS